MWTPATTRSRRAALLAASGMAPTTGGPSPSGSPRLACRCPAPRSCSRPRPAPSTSPEFSLPTPARRAAYAHWWIRRDWKRDSSSRSTAWRARPPVRGTCRDASPSSTTGSRFETGASPASFRSSRSADSPAAGRDWKRCRARSSKRTASGRCFRPRWCAPGRCSDSSAARASSGISIRGAPSRSSPWKKAAWRCCVTARAGTYR